MEERIDLKERGLVRIFAGPPELFAAAAEAFATAVEEAVAARGRASVALSGGGTPGGLYRVLAREPCRARLPWAHLHAFWGDERMVPPDHGGSNFRLVREALFDHVSLPPENLHRMRGESASAESAAADYAAELARFFAPEEPCFDVLWLGLGSDGHTASLFPHSAALDEKRRFALAVSGPAPFPERITLTLPALNRARKVFFLVTGEEKSAVLAEVLEGELRPRLLPAQSVKPVAGELVFWLDRAAASRFSTRRARGLDQALS